MNLNENYTLNSHYILKNDEKRAIITNKSGRDFSPDINANDSFLSIIHPLHAMLLSFFTDEKKLSEKLIELSNFFGIDEKKILDFIANLCENENEFTHQFSGTSFHFPKNVLVKNQKYKGKIYEISDFNITPSDFDFSSPRLYKPLDAILVINTNCATDCIYCYADKSHSYNLLATERIKEILQEAKKIGMRNIDISGGEFLLHKNWEKILTAFFENGFHPYLSTKIPMNENIISKLKDVGVKSMQVSVDTIDDEEAEKVLNVKKGYVEKLIQSLKLLDKTGIKINTNTIVTAKNARLENIKSIVNFLTTLKNISRINIAISGYSHYNGSYSNYVPHIEEIQKIEKYISDVSHIYAGKIRITFDSFLTDKVFINQDYNFKKDEFYHRALCTGNLSNFVILPDGKVTICEELYWHPTFIIGDLTYQTISEIWNSEKAIELYYLTKNSISNNSPCKNCISFNVCRIPKGVCWKMIIKAYGNENWDFPDPRCPNAPIPKEIFYVNT